MLFGDFCQCWSQTMMEYKIILVKCPMLKHLFHGEIINTRM